MPSNVTVKNSFEILGHRKHAGLQEESSRRPCEKPYSNTIALNLFA